MGPQTVVSVSLASYEAVYSPNSTLFCFSPFDAQSASIDSAVFSEELLHVAYFSFLRLFLVAMT